MTGRRQPSPPGPARRPSGAKEQTSSVLSTGNWAVLGVFGEGPTHGFAVATALAPGSDLGEVWTLSRPLVYQSIARLQGAGLLAPTGTERSRLGPSRTILTVTPAGRDALDRWLDAPVEHVRDVRSSLLLKLALRHRSGLPLHTLAEAQHNLLCPGLGALQNATERTDGFDGVVAQWRLLSYQATCAFLEAVIEERR